MPSLIDLYNANRYHDVIKTFLDSDVRPQADPSLAYLVGASYFKVGNYQESFKFFQSIYSSFANDVSFLSVYAASCRHMGKIRDSKAAFDKALEIDPTNIILLNNYSNLLIDMQDFDQALLILQGLVNDNPDYIDARENLSRVKSIIELDMSSLNSNQFEKTSGKSSLSTNDLSQVSAPHDPAKYLDPLLFAFSEDEVKRTAPFRPVVPLTQNSGSLSVLQAAFPSPDLQSYAADQLSLAFRAVQEGNPQLALRACSHALPNLKRNSDLYSCVGEAYLAMKMFQKSELYFLHAISLGGNNFKNNFNLASLACIKNDLDLAEFYLDAAFSIDCSSPLIDRMKCSIQKLRSNCSNEKVFSFEDTNPFKL